MFTYRARITAVYDGDTVTADIDLGFKAVLRGVKLRLYGINAPEVRGISRPAGLQSRDWLRARILDKDVVIQTHKDATGKYGRWLAEIYVLDPDGAPADMPLNEELVEAGLAVEATY